MPNLTALGDPGSLPLAKQAQLTADVAVTPINTYVDIVTLGTLPAGSYMISAYLTLAQITATAVATLKILAGTAIVAATEGSFIVGAGSINIPWFPLVLGADTIVKLQAASTVLTTTAKKVALNNGVGTDNFTTNITALRIA